MQSSLEAFTHAVNCDHYCSPNVLDSFCYTIIMSLQYYVIIRSDGLYCACVIV